MFLVTSLADVLLFGDFLFVVFSSDAFWFGIFLCDFHIESDTHHCSDLLDRANIFSYRLVTPWGVDGP